MIKLISKVELLRGGKSGFELTGVDVIRNTENSRVSDNIVRTRTLPVPFWSRDLFHALRYPVLVYTRHWLPIWNVYMNENKSKINQESLVNCPEEWICAGLTNLWKDTEIKSIEETPKGFKIVASIVMGGKNNGFAAIIDEDADHNIYARVSELFEDICEEFVKLMTQNILPATSEELKEIATEIDSNLGTLSDDEMISKMMELADKRKITIGFTVNDFNEILEELPLFGNTEAVIVSTETKNPEEFQPPLPDEE
jgi:hypothetical protein